MKTRQMIGLALAALWAWSGLAGESKIDVVAVYYPHWHRYPKGDEWFSKKWNWSQGEWAFVKDPVVRFPGQINYKPYVGYLDGSKPEDVETEIALAHNAGIDVFLYDYYWYNGEKTQEEAIEKGLFGAKNRKLMKFALMWCYHDRRNGWRKRYLEDPGNVMSLAHTPEEFLGLIDYSIAHYFNQSEYWRYKGGLFFSIYNISHLWRKWGRSDDKVRETLQEARRRVRSAGLGEMHFNGQDIWPDAAGRFAAMGVDSFTDYGFPAWKVKDAKARYEAGEKLFDFAEADGPLQARWQAMREKSPVPYIPVVPTGWDSTLRCRKDVAFPWGPKQDYPYTPTYTNATADLFEKYLRDAKAAVLADPKQPGAIYVNAWNEYTEGCWLLPSTRRSDLRLRAVARVFGRRPAKEYVYTTGCPHYKGPNAPRGKLCRMETPDLENVRYGRHERQGLDVWFPKEKPVPGGEKTPAVIVIHGGGWTAGDRIPAASGWLSSCRKAGYALVTVGYRFVMDGKDEGLVPPVRAPLDDAIAAIRFVQAHADEWNIDVRRLGLTGGSAGACSSLYAGLWNDCALGIRAVLANSPQTSLDPKEMQEWIPNIAYGPHAFGCPGFANWLADREKWLSWIGRVSPAALLRTCTPAKAPVFLHANGQPMLKPGELAKDATHSPAFSDRFNAIATSRGVTSRWGSRDEFLQILKTAR